VHSRYQARHRVLKGHQFQSGFVLLSRSEVWTARRHGEVVAGQAALGRCHGGNAVGGSSGPESVEPTDRCQSLGEAALLLSVRRASARLFASQFRSSPRFPITPCRSLMEGTSFAQRLRQNDSTEPGFGLMPTPAAPHVPVMPIRDCDESPLRSALARCCRLSVATEIEEPRG
jgi:hypothetical protein